MLNKQMLNDNAMNLHTMNDQSHEKQTFSCDPFVAVQHSFNRQYKVEICVYPVVDFRTLQWLYGQCRQLLPQHFPRFRWNTSVNTVKPVSASTYVC